jgi:hypothetical protein
MRPNRLATLAVPVLLLASCTSSGEQSTSDAPSTSTTTTTTTAAPVQQYASLADLAAKIGCTDINYTDLSSGKDDFGMPHLRTESGSCTRNGQEIQLGIYENANYLGQEQRLAQGFGCEIASSFGITDSYQAYGNFWTAAPRDNLDEQLAQTIADQAGGQLLHVKCES